MGTSLRPQVIGSQSAGNEMNQVRCELRVLHATQSPAASVRIAAGRLEVSLTVLIVGLGETCIDQTIQRDAALCMGRAYRSTTH